MPIVLRSGPYRVYFYSHESNEPAHVHIDRDQASCKFWLSPVSLASDLPPLNKSIRSKSCRESCEVTSDSVSSV